MKVGDIIGAIALVILMLAVGVLWVVGNVAVLQAVLSSRHSVLGAVAIIAACVLANAIALFAVGISLDEP